MEEKEILFKREELEEAMVSLPKVGPFGEELVKNPDQSVIISKTITADGVSPRAELHENYTDIFLVQEGEEELFIGGEIADKQETGPGEWRGQNLEGARTYKVKAGDIVVIPKGVAHRHGLGTIKIIVIKTA